MLAFAWELDFWGKYRRATEAARANLLATEWARRAVINTLVSDVAAAYFQLRALRPAAGNLAANAGFAPGLAATHADAGKRRGRHRCSTSGRRSSWLPWRPKRIPDLERRIEQQENFISTLLGNNPGPIARGMKLTEQPHLPEVPAGNSLQPAGAAARYPRGGSAVDGGQRSNRSS